MAISNVDSSNRIDPPKAPDYSREPSRLPEGTDKNSFITIEPNQRIWDRAKKDLLDSGVKNPSVPQINNRLGDYEKANAGRLNLSELIAGDQVSKPAPLPNVGYTAGANGAGKPGQTGPAAQAEALRQAANTKEVEAKALAAAQPAFRQGTEAIIAGFNNAKSPKAQSDAIDLARQQLKQPGAALLSADDKKNGKKALEGVANSLKASELTPVLTLIAEPPISAENKKQIETILDGSKHLAGQGDYIALETAIGRKISAPAPAMAGQIAEIKAKADADRATAAAAQEAKLHPHGTSPGHVSPADQKRSDDAADAATRARQAARTEEAKGKATGSVAGAAASLRANPQGQVDTKDLQEKLDAAKKYGVTSGADVETLKQAIAAPNPPAVKRAETQLKAALDKLKENPEQRFKGFAMRNAIEEAQLMGVKPTPDDQKWIDYATKKLNGQPASIPGREKENFRKGEIAGVNQAGRSDALAAAAKDVNATSMTNKQRFELATLLASAAKDPHSEADKANIAKIQGAINTLDINRANKRGGGVSSGD